MRISSAVPITAMSYNMHSFEKFKDDMAEETETWGQEKPFPFAKPLHGFDKTVVARPGYEWLKEYRDADQGYTDNRIDAEAATRRRARG